MTIELQADGRAVASGAGEHAGTGGRVRPNVSGDLPSLLAAAPMFRRAVGGYDRFQVESYVQWAEEELAAADRERAHLVARQLDTAAALEEARELLSHSPDGCGFIEVSRRIGAMLAAAADEAAAIRTEAETIRRDARAAAERIGAEARRRADATATVADRSLAAARDDAAAMVERARSVAATVGQDAARLRAAAEERLAAAQDLARRAAADAVRLREQAAEEIVVARLQARDDILRLLAAGREERRRADALADAARAQPTGVSPGSVTAATTAR